MEILLVFLCCGSLVITTVFGLGITFVLERFLGIWAYVAGALIPVILFTALYTLYHIYVRATPCEPVGSLACGEPFLVAFFLFLAVAFVMLLANVAAQTSLYFFLYGRRQTFSAALYEEGGEETGENAGAPAAAGDAYSEAAAGDPMQAHPAEVEIVEEQYIEEQYTQEPYPDDSPYSGLPPGAPEDEPPVSR